MSSRVFQVMYEKGEGGHLDAPLIEGHLNLTVELISALPTGDKFVVGSKEGGVGLIKVSAAPNMCTHTHTRTHAHTHTHTHTGHIPLHEVP